MLTFVPRMAQITCGVNTTRSFQRARSNGLGAYVLVLLCTIHARQTVSHVVGTVYVGGVGKCAVLRAGIDRHQRLLLSSLANALVPSLASMFNKMSTVTFTTTTSMYQRAILYCSTASFAPSAAVATLAASCCSDPSNFCASGKFAICRNGFSPPVGRYVRIYQHQITFRV